MKLIVQKSDGLVGEVRLPRSKTHSFRALILASLADGTSCIREPKLSSDWYEAVNALRMYGAKITEVKKNVFEITGVGNKLQTPIDCININNSGTMLFFIIGLAAACPGWSIISGDESIRTLRKISEKLLEPYQELGITFISTKNDGMAPFIIKGGINGGIAHMDGIGCQPVFSVLLSAALSSEPIEIFVRNPGEKAYIDLLLYWFTKVGIKYKNINQEYSHYIFPGNTAPRSFNTIIPFEMSAPWYPLLAAILTPESTLTVKGLDLSDPYGDKKVLTILQEMGADIHISSHEITASTSKLMGIEIDMNDLPDQVPTIAIAACFAQGKTVIKNAVTARWKECDRIHALYTELTKMGAKVYEKTDGLIIDNDGTWKLHATEVNGYYDHRMILALSIAGLQLQGKTTISDAQMVEKSFETYIPDMIKAGAKFTLYERYT